jgi:hypothetical protein
VQPGTHNEDAAVRDTVLLFGLGEKVDSPKLETPLRPDGWTFMSGAANGDLHGNILPSHVHQLIGRAAEIQSGSCSGLTIIKNRIAQSC